LNGKVIISRDVVFDEEASWDWNIQEEKYDFLPYFEEDDENESTRDEMGESLPIPVPPHSTDQSSFEGSSSDSENKIGPRGTRSLRELNEVNENQNDIILYCLFGDCEPLVSKKPLQTRNGRMQWMKKFER